MSNVQYQLIDLDLTDGITPSITFDADDEVTVYSSIRTTPPLPIYEQILSDFGSTTMVGDYAHTSATLGLNGGSNQVTLTPASVWQSAGSSSQLLTRFTLSPSTGLSFSASATIAADAQTHAAEATAIFIADLSYTHNGVFRLQEYVEAYSTHNGARDYLFNGYFVSGREAASGTFNMRTWSSATTIAPVPEPATYGMLLAGALVVGLAARRRRR